MWEPHMNPSDWWLLVDLWWNCILEFTSKRLASLDLASKDEGRAFLYRKPISVTVLTQILEAWLNPDFCIDYSETGEKKNLTEDVFSHSGQQLLPFIKIWLALAWMMGKLLPFNWIKLSLFLAVHVFYITTIISG